MAHRVSAIETTLYKEVEVAPSCPRSLLSRRHALRSMTGRVVTLRTDVVQCARDGFEPQKGCANHPPRRMGNSRGGGRRG
eukprot:7840996-Pyramimonas_sp.AAC.1